MGKLHAYYLICVVFILLLTLLWPCISTPSPADAEVIQWKPVHPPVIEKDLYGVWGSSAIDVYAVGISGTILHYDGSKWRVMASPPNTDNLYAIWGSSSSDVYTVGRNGTILHCNGSKWTSVEGGVRTSLFGIWGSSTSDVFAVGQSGTIVHYDGKSWNVMTSGISKSLCGVWGSSANDVFAVGIGGVILHYDGSNWKLMTGPAPAVNLYAVWGTSETHVFAVGQVGTVLSYDGKVWSSIYRDPIRYFDGIWGSSSSDVYAVGVGIEQEENILHYDGNKWISMDSRNAAIVRGIWGSSRTNIFAVGRPTILQTEASSAPPIVMVQSASLSSSVVRPGIPVIVTAKVVNKGTIDGFTSVKLYVNGKEEFSRSIVVPAAETESVSFAVSRSQPGIYAVSVGEMQAGSFTVDWFAGLGRYISYRRYPNLRCDYHDPRVYVYEEKGQWLMLWEKRIARNEENTAGCSPFAVRILYPWR